MYSYNYNNILNLHKNMQVTEIMQSKNYSGNAYNHSDQNF